MRRLLNLIFEKSVNEQEEDYLIKYGYPKETVVFVDSMGRMSQIIGSEILLKVCNLSKSIKIAAKK